MTAQQHIASARVVIDDVVCARRGYITFDVQCAMGEIEASLKKALEDMDKERKQEEAT